MSTPFQYCSISTEFISELSEMALDGKSMVLLGSRYGGKRRVMFRIRNYLSKTQAGPVVWIKFLSDPPVSSAQRAGKFIWDAVMEAAPQLKRKDPSEDLLDAIDQLHGYTGDRVVLIAANVDGMAHHLARRFLEGVRRRVEEGWLVVVLSGEDDFRDLVYGPNSEFNCANQFVLQGFAEDEFNSFIDSYLALMHEDFNLSPAKRHELWAYTGGNTYLMRMILWFLIEDRVRLADRQVANSESLDTSSPLKPIGILRAFSAYVFLHTTDLISRDPECWGDLEKLKKGKTVRVGLEDNPPSRLELAGVAIRSGNQLQFASELMRKFVEQHYNDQRFGDLYASSGHWEKAFERYALLSLEETMRPAGTNDKAAIEATINALCAALHSEAAKGVEDVRQLFVKGCRYLLGFRDITFWQSNSEWQPVPLRDFTPSRENLEQIAALLPQHGSLQPDLLQLAEPLAKCSVASILPAIGREQRGAVVIGDFEKRTVISRERKRLAEEMLKHFRAAYSHAVHVEKTARRLEVRNKHIQIINSIFDALGSEIINPLQVINMAARELRQLGYRRVLFCLVDTQQERIKGVWDDSDDRRVDVAKMTDWPLDKPTADLQPYVIFTKKPEIVPDTTKEPLANPKVVQKANMKSVAIVPILNPDEEAIGTIHIERTDGTVPRPHEVADLLLFGRQLAVVIEQSERVNMLQSALDKIPEPVLIIDSLEKIRYANKVAGDLIGVATDWQSRSKAAQLSGVGTEQILEYLRKPLKDHNRRVRHFTGIGNNPNYRGAMLLDKIQDWRGQTVGALLHIEDLNYFYQILEAFRYIAEANDTGSAMESMLQAMQRLGHEWGRLYFVDEQNEDRLISRLCFGMLPEDQEAFNRREVALQLHSAASPIAWKCIDEKKPLVLCWDENFEDRASKLTEHGLRAFNINPPVSPPETRKKPGDFWIDYPLFAEEKVLGKMTLHCKPDFRPEDFEMLKVFSGGLLDAVQRREDEFKQRERLLRQAADDAVGLTAHNLNSQLPMLTKLLSHYRELEPQGGAILELNKRFKSDMEVISSTINRMKERLGPLDPKPESFDLIELLQQALSNSLSEEEGKLADNYSSMMVYWDRHLIHTTLTELIHNSKAFIPENRDLRVCVDLELETQGFVEWVKIVYRDNGSGVPAEFKNRIFDQFFSHRPGKERGTGIGLRFVQRVVQAHGGTVREIGQFGRGAEFEIRVPQKFIHAE